MDADHIQPKAVISGSFTRHIEDIQSAVHELTYAGALVLSPEAPYPTGATEGFIHIESDRTESVKPTQDRHLSAIAAADFLWLCCAEGYVGTSAAMEVGYAVAHSTPVYCDFDPLDTTLRHYVRKISSATAALLVYQNELKLGTITVPNSRISASRQTAY